MELLTLKVLLLFLEDLNFKLYHIILYNMCDTTFIHETETSIEENIFNIFGNYRHDSLQQAQKILNLLSNIKGRLAKKYG